MVLGINKHGGIHLWPLKTGPNSRIANRSKTVIFDKTTDPCKLLESIGELNFTFQQVVESKLADMLQYQTDKTCSPYPEALISKDSNELSRSYLSQLFSIMGDSFPKSFRQDYANSLQQVLNTYFVLSVTKPASNILSETRVSQIDKTSEVLESLYKLSDTISNGNKDIYDLLMDMPNFCDLNSGEELINLYSQILFTTRNLLPPNDSNNGNSEQ